MTLFELIQQTERLLDAIATHPQYRLLKDNEHLTNLDLTLADAETFLWQLNAALKQAAGSQAGSGSLPSFDQLFDEQSLSNFLSLLEPSVSEIKGFHL